MIPKMFGGIDLLQKGMDAAWVRNEVISNNIANAETPNFKSSSVEFESIFQKALNDQLEAQSGAVGVRAPEQDAFAATIEPRYENKRTRDKHIAFSKNEELVKDPVRMDTDFASKRTRENHFTFADDAQQTPLSDVTAQVTKNDKTNMRYDGNNVDVEAENVALARNTVYYYTLTEQINSEFARLGMAIREGK